MNFPPIPIDFSQVPAWLIMPSVLILFASLVIDNFFKQSTDQQKNFIKFVVFIIDALVSFLLTKLSPDFVASIEPLWAILAAVIAVYYAPTVIKQVWAGVKMAALAIYAVTLRFAFGPEKAHEVWVSPHHGG